MKNGNLLGQTLFITGATSGLGVVAACQAANQGAKVIVMARNLEKGQTLLENYSANFSSGKGKIDIVEGNLNSFQSIVSACKKVHEKYDHLDMIINNAGIMNFKFQASKNGIEETLQINLLAPILVTDLLIDLLQKSSNPKIINTVSGLHQGIINFDNLEFKDDFNSFKTYRQSKLGLILLGRLLAKKLSKYNIHVYSQHPGMVRTEIGRSGGWLARIIFWSMGKSPEKGAQTLLYLMNTLSDDLVSGEYYVDNKVTKITEESYDLTVAKKLLGVTKTYLKPHLNGSSIIFDDIKI